MNELYNQIRGKCVTDKAAKEVVKIVKEHYKEQIFNQAAHHIDIAARLIKDGFKK